MKRHSTMQCTNRYNNGPTAASKYGRQLIYRAKRVVILKRLTVRLSDGISLGYDGTS